MTRRLTYIPGLRPPVMSHQGGWDEALIFFGIPIVLFAVLRWLGLRRERRERAAGESNDDV